MRQAPTAPPRPPGPARTPGSWQAALSPGELIAAIGVSTVAVVGMIVWATVQLSGRLWSGRWPDLGYAETAISVLRLGRNPGEPAAAFSHHVGGLLPGPVVFWGTFVVLMAVPVAAVAYALRWWRRNRDDGEPGQARWARIGDLAPLIVRRPTQGRLTVGYGPKGRLLACEPGHSLLVLGPTQSGKTSGLAIPAILEWDGPVVATSVKNDLLAHSLQQRQLRGEVTVYDPTGSVTTDSASWTPLAACRTWQGALRTASSLAESGRQTLLESDFWYSSATKMLAPMLFAAAKADLPITEVIRWIDTQEQDEIMLHLELAGVPAATHAAKAHFEREPRTRSSVSTTAENILRAFTDPSVADTADDSDISADRLLDGANTLYICAPLHEQARLQPLFTTLVRDVLTAAYDRAARDGVLDPRLLLVLDEAANIAPLPDLAQVASTAAGLGIQLVTVWQDRSQIVSRYGQDAGTVINNHRAKLILSGIYDPDTTGDVSQVIGDTQVVRRSTSVAADGRVSATDAPQRLPLADPARLRQLQPYEGVLIYGRLPAAKVKLRSFTEL